MRRVRPRPRKEQVSLIDTPYFIDDILPSTSSKPTESCSNLFPISLWEGRFKSQALLDEAAVLSCMAYVDLNPIRAKIARTAEYSAHTSINGLKHHRQPRKLCSFIGNPRQEMPEGLPYSLIDYIELVENTGRIVRQDKRGCIIPKVPILERFGIDEIQWLEMSLSFEKQFGYAAGREMLLQQYQHHTRRLRRRSV